MKLCTVLFLLSSCCFPRILHKQQDMSARESYLKRVMLTPQAISEAPVGSLWRPDSPIANLGSDPKAHALGDILAIVISENTSSVSSGDIKGARNGSLSGQVTDLGGKLSTKNAFSDLYGANSSAALHGQGSATFSNALQTTMSATVIAQLPNGDLVIEGMRNLDIEHQKQTVTIRGVARRMDIRSDNSVPSNALANLEIEVKGKGTVSDFTRPVHPLFRFVMKWLGI